MYTRWMRYFLPFRQFLGKNKFRFSTACTSAGLDVQSVLQQK